VSVPPPDSQPTLGEVMRRLDDTSSQLARLADQMRTDRDRADMRFVPRGEWVEGRRADQGRIAETEKDVVEIKGKETAREQADTTWRRQILLAFAVAAFSGIVSVAVAIAGLILGKGP
jgi:hypothetical protein